MNDLMTPADIAHLTTARTAQLERLGKEMDQMRRDRGIAHGLGTDSLWLPTKDGDPRALALFHQHYSYRPYADGRKPRLFVGPGEKMVLLTVDCRALWVWRKMRGGGMDGQEGVNCAVFRNEGEVLSSTLIAEAEQWAWQRWPGERLYTYVKASAIRSTNPGYCFLKSGWAKCGMTKVNKLIIMERLP